ncbi:MAG: transglutaminase domain-containing protein [Saprospiraceae bacterium]
MKKIIITPLFLFLMIGMVIGQEDINKYTQVDLQIKDKWIRSNDVDEIAEEITADYDDEEQKVRAIFVWITENIEYSLDIKDDRKRNRSKRRIKTRDPEEKAELELELKNDDLKTALKARGAIEADYSYMFIRMCEAAEIEAGEIKGYLRRSERKVGKMPRRADHKWNWAKINGKKYLFDTMLASGKVARNKETKQIEFVKKFNDIYFMTPPEIMVLNHYPEKEEYQLLDEAVSKETFANYPFVLGGYKESKIEEFLPMKGLISLSETEVVFKLKFRDGEIPNRIMLQERRKLSEQEFLRDGDYFICTYKIPESRPKTLKIIIKGSKLYEHEALVYVMGTE